MRYRIHNMICRICGSNDVILDLATYNCMNCGNRWFVDGYEPTELEYLEMENEIRMNSEKRRFEHRVRRQDVMMAFSPSERFSKNLESDLGTGVPLGRYRYELGSLLLEGASFHEVKDVSIPAGCSKADFDAYIRDYLSSRDELPFSPSLDDWCKYLHVSEKELNGIYKSEPHVNISYFLNPDMIIHDVFSIVFSGRIKAAVDQLDEGHLDMLYENTAPEFCFEDYYDSNSYAEFFVNQFLNEEKNVIDRFFVAGKEKGQEFYNKAIEEHLSIIDTMMLFVDYAFKGYKGY